MKILKSHAISSFGGYNFVSEELDKLGIDNLLRRHLPTLSAQCKYQWKDLLYSFWSIFFCGGDCIEDLSVHLKDSFAKNPLFKVPSPDRLLDRMKELALPSDNLSAPRGKAKHLFSINTSLNRLNLQLLNKLSNIKSQDIVLDYDNTLLFTRKADAAMTYKKQFGYAPGVGIMGNNVVYVENRNGNSAAANLQEDTLERMFTLIKEQGIRVSKFRADGASYKLAVLSVINKHVSKFYIRANMNQSLNEAISKIDNWEKVELENETAFRGSVMFIPFESIAARNKSKEQLKTYKLVVTKVKRDDGQFNLFTGEPCNYHAIITNDFSMTNNEIVFFYNQRGAIEREFDVLKNDFGWNNMPFSKLEYNTVFLILTAICRNIYNYIICSFSKKYENLSPSFRIKKFIFRFICIPAKWIISGRIIKLRIYGGLAYKT